MFGSGRIETRHYNLSGFTAIRASRFEIEIVQSRAYSVTVRADDNLFGKLDVRTSGDTLILRTRRMLFGLWRGTIEATITMPALTGIELHGAAKARVRDFRDIGRLDVVMEGASDLRGKMEAQSMKISASGASRLALAGSADDVTVSAQGASKLDLAALATSTGAFELSGASRTTVNVASKIEYLEASGASRIRYLGNPAIGRIDSSGASRVTRG